MNDVDNGRGYACVGAGVIWDISVPPYYFVVNLKLLYKYQIFKKILTKCAFLKVIPFCWSPSSFLLEKFSLTGNSVLHLELLSLHIKFTFALPHSSICFVENEILNIEEEKERKKARHMESLWGCT